MLMPEEAYQLLTSRKAPIGVAEEEQARGLAADLGYYARDRSSEGQPHLAYCE